MSLIGKIQQLNDADLSRISNRLAVLRAGMERDLELKGGVARPVSTLTVRKDTNSNLTPDQLLEALETAQRVT